MRPASQTLNAVLFFAPKLALQKLAERVAELEKDKTDAAALQEQLAHARDRNIRLQQQIDEDPKKVELRQAPKVEDMGLDELKVHGDARDARPRAPAP